MIFVRGAIGACVAALLVGSAHSSVAQQEAGQACSEPTGACADADSASAAAGYNAALEASRKAGAAAMKATPEAQQIDLAYKAVFEGGRPEIETSSGRKLLFEGGKVIWIDDTAILVAPASNSGSWPNTTGTLGIFYLKPDGKKFEVLRRFPFAIDGSIMGNPPEWEISEDMTNVPVIISTASGVWQGTNCATTTLTEIWPVSLEGKQTVFFHPAFENGHMVSFRSAFDNSGGSPNRDAIQSITGKIANVQKNISFDVVFTGTLTFTHRYKRDSGSYVRLADGANNELPEC